MVALPGRQAGGRRQEGGDADAGVLVQVGADAGAGGVYGDAHGLQRRAGADAAAHQQRRAVQGAGAGDEQAGVHGLAVHLGGHGLAVPDGDALDLGAGAYLQVGAAADGGGQVGGRGAGAGAVLV